MEEITQIFCRFLTKLHRHDSYIFIQSPLQDANPTAVDTATQKSHAPVVKTMEDVAPISRGGAALGGCIWANNFYIFTYFLFAWYFISVNKAIKLFSSCLTVIIYTGWL